MTYQNIVIFGEVLFDRLPDGRMILGGAPFNIAWNLQAFGINPLFISRVGNDYQGEMIKETMKIWRMNTDFIQTDSQYPTGVVEVNLIDGEPHYNIMVDRAYDFIEPVTLFSPHHILYHGTLALRNPRSNSTFLQIKKTNFNHIFYDVNLRNPFWNLAKINQLLKEVSTVKLNQQELYLLVTKGDNIEDKVKYLFSQYKLTNIIITQGKEGATFFTNQEKKYQIKPSENVSIVDTVGAGDAFCSVLLLGMLKKWDIITTINYAQEFASKIIKINGATTTDKSFYQSLIKEWEKFN